MYFWSGGKWARCPPTLPSWSSLLGGGGCCWVAQSCLTLCNPMDCSMPGHPSPSPGVSPSFFLCISDAAQPPHPLVPSSSALSLSQHQASLRLDDFLYLSFKSSWYILPHYEPSSISYSVSWNTTFVILIKSYFVLFFVALCFWCHIKEKTASSDIMKVHDYIPF